MQDTVKKNHIFILDESLKNSNNLIWKISEPPCIDFYKHIILKDAVVQTDTCIISINNNVVEMTRYLNKKILEIENEPKYFLGNFFCAGNGGYSYFHFLLQTLPSLIFFLESITDKYNFTVFSSKTNNYIKIFCSKYSIKFASFAEKFVKLQTVYLNQLLYTDTNDISLKKNLLNIIFKKNNKINKFKRIYISRQDSKKRPFRNELDLMRLLFKLNFEILISSKYSIEEQSNIFRNAECVVGIHGAGLSNIVFSDNCSTVIEIFDSSYLNPVFAKMCLGLNIEYYCFIFNNFFIDIGFFKSKVVDILKNC